MARKFPDFRRTDDSKNFEYFLEDGKVNSSSQKPAILLISGGDNRSHIVAGQPFQRLDAEKIKSKSNRFFVSKHLKTKFFR